MALNRRADMLRVLLLTIVLAAAAVRAPGQQLYTGSSEGMAAGVDKMYLKGLAYLQRTQAPEGNWPDEPHGTEPALTAFAVISLSRARRRPEFRPLHQKHSHRPGLHFEKNGPGHRLHRPHHV